MPHHSIVLGHLPETDGKSRWQKTLYARVIRLCARVLRHAAMELLLRWKLHPYCLAFTAPEGAMHITGGETHQQPEPAVNALNYDQFAWQAMPIGTAIACMLQENLSGLFKAHSTRKNSCPTLLAWQRTCAMGDIRPRGSLLLSLNQMDIILNCTLNTDRLHLWTNELPTFFRGAFIE